MRVAVVDSNYLANKRNIEDFLKKEGYNPLTAEFDVYALAGRWGRGLIELDKRINFYEGDGVDSVTEELCNNNYDWVFVSLDKPDDYNGACKIIHSLDCNEVYAIEGGKCKKVTKHLMAEGYLENKVS